MAFLLEFTSLSKIPVLEEKPRLPWPKPLHCLTFKPGLEFYYTARLLILQFVLLKPLLSIVCRFFHLFFKCQKKKNNNRSLAIASIGGISSVP